MKLLLFLIILTFISQIGYAQLSITTYFTKEGKETKDQTIAQYYRLVELVASEEESSIVVQEKFIQTNNTKLIGSYNNFKDKKFVGQKLEAYENGKLKSKEKYSNDGVLIDTAYYYYPNGKIKYAYHYPNAIKDNKTVVSDTLFLIYKDSIGNILLQDGIGYAELEHSNGDIEKGKYISHKKEGEWEGSFSKGYTFKENYNNGKLVSGVSTDSLENEVIYDNSNFKVEPAYPNGIHALRVYIANNFNYPKEAIQNRVAGTIRVSFVVEKDGSIDNLSIDEDLGYGTGKEAIRIIKRAKKWSPGLMRGVPVRVKYNIPIRINLNNK